MGVLVILFAILNVAFGGVRWTSEEGHEGNDIVVEGGLDDSYIGQPRPDSVDGSHVCEVDVFGYPSRGHGMYYTPWKGSYPKCSDHEYYGSICDLNVPHSKKCPNTKCCYTTKTATLATSHGTRMTVELRTPYTIIAWQCKDMKKVECSKNCECSTIWCKARRKKTIKAYKKYYAMETVYIPYSCGCQCRSTVGW